jgi:ABC-type transporter Mla maintaining outer membrane lipid asymmetry permease subunit MlaE
MTIFQKTVSLCITALIAALAIVGGILLSAQMYKQDNSYWVEGKFKKIHLDRVQ